MLSQSLTRDSVAHILAAMDNFLEYVKQRKAAIRKELAELEAAERVYRQSGAESGERNFSFDLAGPTDRPTIQEGILQLLEEAYPMGLTAMEILDRLNRRWWRGQLRRTSLSPQITRLKKKKKVVSERGTWRCVKNEAPEAAGPSGADDSMGNA